jgi:hypothetical protein
MNKTKKGQAPRTRDYLAELHVAGLFGDAGWQVFFPKRDEGFDFIAVKRTPTGSVVRPVQVKGLYPTAGKKDRVVYPWKGKLSQTHADLVVAFVYFHADLGSDVPACIAYVPFGDLRQPTRGGYAFTGASLRQGRVSPRRDYRHYFGREGLQLLAAGDHQHA